MRQSVYLRLAVFFVQLDLQREDAQWRHIHRRVRVQLPHLSAHIMRDVGIDADERIANHLLQTPAGRQVQHLRQRSRLRSIT